MNSSDSQNAQSNGEGRFARAYAEWVVRNRYIVIFAVLICTVAAALYLKDIDMRNDPDTLLPASNRYVATNNFAEKEFGMGNLMVFALRVKEGNIYQPWFINKVQELHRELEELPTARKANFIDLAAQKIKYMGADEYGGLVFKRLIPTSGISDNPEKAAEELAFLKEGIETNPVLAPMLVYMEDPQGNRCTFEKFDGKGEGKGCEAKAAFIIGDYTDDVKEIYLPWVREVRAIMDRYNEDERVEVYVAGEPYFLAWMLADLVNKWWLFVISVVIVLLVLWYEFRNWRGAIFPMIGVGATVVMTLGLMGFTAFKLTTMMVLTPMLLLAIGVGHSVQITRRFMQEQGRHGDCRKAAVDSISVTIVPATLAIVTDMVGFATLATVDISFYKDYAYFGMFGMLTLLVTTTTLIPLMLMIFPCAKADAAHGGHAWEEKLGNGITSMLLSGPGKVVPLAFVAVVIGISVYYSDLKDGTWEDLMPGVEKGIDYSRAAFKEKSITIQHITQLNEIMPGVISVTIPIRGKVQPVPQCADAPFSESIWDIEDKKEKAAACQAEKERRQCWDPEPCGAQGVFNKSLVLRDIEKLEDWMRANPFIGYTGSYAQYIKLVNLLLVTEPGSPQSIEKDFHIPTNARLKAVDPDDDRDADAIVEMYNGLLETMTTSGDMDSFLNTSSWNEGVVMGFINTMDPKETHQVTMEIQQYIEDHKNDDGFKLVNFGLRNEDISGDTNELSQPGPDYVRPGLGGFLGATEATREVAFDNWLSGPLLTAAAVFVIAALIFRSVVVSAILLSLLLITLFAQYGLGGYFTSVKNWSGNLAFHLQVALSIAMGLGVDYGIYMISRLKDEMKATGGVWSDALRNTLNTTGSAVIISVIVLVSCFIPLLNTDLANTWGLAVYIIEALLIDVVTALTLLPLLVYWFKPKYVFGNR